MCKTCGHDFGTTRHLLYWQYEWLKRFLLTWYHIINRRAYRKWREDELSRKIKKSRFFEVDDFDDGLFVKEDCYLIKEDWGDKD